MPDVAACAAANSMASGMPSRCRQIAPMPGSSPGPGEKSASDALVRVMNSSTALLFKMCSASSCPAAGTSSGGSAIDMLALDPEGFPARRDDRGVRAVRQKRFGQGQRPPR